MAVFNSTATAAFGLVWFVLWTVFSFCAHFFAKKTLFDEQQNSDVSSTAERWLLITILTLVQVGVGSILIRVFLILLKKNLIPNIHNNESSGHSKTNGKIQEADVEPCFISLYLSHAAATMATNASIAYVNTGSAFTIKAFEPVTSAVLTSMLLGTKLSAHVVIALPLVVSGALGFVSTPGLGSTALLGLGMAFVSNLLFGVRNINIKLHNTTSNSVGEKLNILLKASNVSAIALSLLSAVLYLLSTQFTLGDVKIGSALLSGTFHVTYTLISTCIILQYTSIVGHATANLLKRILVAAVFFLLGKTLLTTENWLMGGVMVVGLVLYAFPKFCPFNANNASLSFISVMAVVILLVTAFSPTSFITSNTKECDTSLIKLPPLTIQKEVLSRKNDLQKDRRNEAIAKKMEVNVYEHPNEAHLVSIEMTNTIDLIKEAYRLHDQVFTHVIGKYKRAVLVNVFQWFNKGDHLITIGQRRILERMGIELIYHCYYPGRDCDFSKINKDDPDLVILVQGAGYIGHPSHELVITKTLEGFPKRRVMVFPISVCHPTPPCDQIVEFARIFKSHQDVHIVLRDKYSFELAEEYFKSAHNYLAPDSAFAVGSIRMNIVPVYDIIWLKRNDWESQKDAMPDFKQYPHIKVQVTDWSDDWMKQESADFWEDHQLRTMTGISFLARAKVVVSDRLHAHIMCQLMGKLNVVINSETKKQEHYYHTWEQSVMTSVLVNSNIDAMAEALKLLEKYKETVTIV